MENLLILKIEPFFFLGGGGEVHEIIHILPIPGFPFYARRSTYLIILKGSHISIATERSSIDLKQYKSLPLD
jgi:hypothetical protein